MSEQRPLTDPFLILYAFFSNAQEGKIARQWGQVVADRLGVPLHTEKTTQPIDLSKDVCFTYPHHDVRVVYVSADMKGPYPFTAWQELGEKISGTVEVAWRRLNQQDLSKKGLYWGTSVFFGAQVEPPDLDSEAQLHQISLWPESEFKPLLSKQLWGNLWQLAGWFPPHAGKTTGLCAFGDERKDRPCENERFPNRQHGSHRPQPA